MNPTPQAHPDGIRVRSGAVRPSWLTLAGAFMAACALAGCDSVGPSPEAFRFGQIGSIQVLVEAPLRGLDLGDGSLVQELEWTSNGAWVLRETINYRSLAGDNTVVRSSGYHSYDPGISAGSYAELINKVNGEAGLQLFPDVEQDPIDPETPDRTCGSTQSRVTLTINDDVREQRARFVRCANGSLTNLTTEGAGPMASAARVIAAVLFVRQGTVLDTYRSAYAGSVPFGTLDRGDDTPSSFRTPAVITDAGRFAEFWGTHAPGRPIPDVAFPLEMVVVAVLGQRQEAGDSVEVRRIVQVGDGTQTEIVELVPGDFCSPASRPHVPFHIVVAPRLPDPQRFAEPTVKEVSCG